MRPLRCVLLLSGAVISSAGFASYELALISGVRAGSYQIMRFDAPTGRYMGSFGAGELGLCAGIGLDSWNNGTVVAGVATNNVIGYKRFDYSTGMMVDFRTRTVSNGIYGFTASTDGSLFYYGNFGSNREIRSYNPNLDPLRTLSLPGSGTIVDVASSGPSATYALVRETGSSSGFKFSLHYFNQSATSPSATRVVLDNVADSGFYESVGINGNNVIVGGATLRDSRVYTPLAGNLSFVGFMGGSMTAQSQVLLSGHFDRVYSFGYNTSTSTADIYRANMFDRTFELIDSNGSSALSNAIFADGAMVVAPEPGTLLVLCGGFAALVARRRHRR